MALKEGHQVHESDLESCDLRFSLPVISHDYCAF
jgi:hypothetical protein